MHTSCEAWAKEAANVSSCLRFHFLCLRQLKPLKMSVLFFPCGCFLLMKNKAKGPGGCVLPQPLNVPMSSAGKEAMQMALQTDKLSHRGLLQLGPEPWHLQFSLGPFLTQQLWSSHMLTLWHAVYARAGHSFPTSNAPFTRDILLPSECLASLSSIFIWEFNRPASFTKTPYKKSWKCFTMPTKICTINCLTLG